MTAVDRGSDLEALLCLIAARHGDMPPVLCRIAEFALDHPNEVALETVAELVRQAPGHDRPPLKDFAAVLLELDEAAVLEFRSLTTGMCLSQALVISLGRRMPASRANGADS